MKNRTILVVGRGVSGLFSALRLQEAGHRVYLLGPASGSGSASSAAVGMCSVKGLLLARDEVFKQKLLGHRRMPELIRELEIKSGLTIPHHFSGVYECFEGAKHYTTLRERLFRGEFTGCFDVKTIGLTGLKDCSQTVFQSLSNGLGVSGALCYPGDGWFDPPSFLKALEKSFEGAGGVLVSGLLHDLKEASEGPCALDAYYEPLAEHPPGDSSPAIARIKIQTLVLATGPQLEPMIKAYLEPADVTLSTLPGMTLSANPLGVVPSNFQGMETIRFSRFGLNVSPKELRFGSMDFPKNSVPDHQDKKVVQSDLINKLKSELSVELGVHNKIRGLFGVRTLEKTRKPFLKKLRIRNSRMDAWVIGGMHKNGFDFAPLFGGQLVRELESEA